MEVPRGGLMEEMTWPEVAAAAQANLPVVLPIGSTEQHGPHLPLGSDCYLPQGIALEVGRRLPLVVAPPIRFGARSRALSGGGETFPGTLSLRATTLIATIHEVLNGLVRTGFKRLCVQNWHYENAGLLWEACDLAANDHADIQILLLENPMPDFSEEELRSLFPQGFPGWDVEHASIMETSMMFVLRPDLVHRDRIVDDEARRHPAWDVIPAPGDFIPRSGVLWHPSEATDEIGRMFVDAVTRRLEQALRTEFGL
jgi:creatinine amidohydrolase